MRRVHLETTDSTNERAKVLVRDGCALPMVVTADAQRGGRGRMGRVWNSPRGGVWMSIAWETARETRETGAIGMLLALGVVRAVDEIAPELGERVRIKWPNDVLVDGKKICGVLCERLGRGAGDVVVGGVGVNGDFSVEALPEEVHESATTLRDATGRRVDAVELRDRLIDRVWERVEVFEAQGVRESEREAIEARLAMRGEEVRIDVGAGRVVEGVLRGIGVDGNARVESGGEVVQIGTGEVVHARRAGAGG